MAIVAMPGLRWPNNLEMPGSAPVPAFTVNTMNNNPEMVAWIFAPPKAGAIRKIGFCTGTVTTDGGYEVRLETVSARVPTGSLFGTNTNIAVAAGSLVSNSMIISTLTADATVTEDSLLAIVIKTTSSTSWVINMGMGAVASWCLPYTTLAATGGAYTVQNGTLPIFYIEYSDGSTYETPGVWPITAINTHTYNSGSAADEIALKFQVPVTCQIGGVSLPIDLDNNTDLVLYAANGTTVLVSSSVTSDGRSATSGQNSYQHRFQTKVTLSANTVYYLSIKPTSGSNISIYSMDVGAVAHLDMMSGGQNVHYASRVDAGSWTAITTRRPMIQLLLDGIDVADADTNRATQLVDGKGLVA